ncbi:MAG: RNB domain-containing ribonuclease, partial [Planctomycetota bacterium]
MPHPSPSGDSNASGRDPEAILAFFADLPAGQGFKFATLMQKMGVAANHERTFRRQVRELISAGKLSLHDGRIARGSARRAIVGRVQLKRDGFGFLICEDIDAAGEDIFLPAPNLAGAHDGDRVEVEVVERRAAGERRGNRRGAGDRRGARAGDSRVGRVVKILERSRQTLCGSFVAATGRYDAGPYLPAALSPSAGTSAGHPADAGTDGDSRGHRGGRGGRSGQGRRSEFAPRPGRGSRSDKGRRGHEPAHPVRHATQAPRRAAADAPAPRNGGRVVPEMAGWYDPVLVAPEDQGDARDGDKVELELLFDDPRSRHGMLHGRVVAVLGPSGEAKAEVEAIVRNYGVRTHFPAPVVAEAAALSLEITPAELARRVDYRRLTTCTIDPDDAKDFDDAISIEHHHDGSWTLYVHIADVSHFVRENSLLDIEARERGNSTYLPGVVYPMLPPAISNDLC